MALPMSTPGKKVDVNNRIFNGYNNSRSDRGQKPESSNYSSNRRNHPTGGQKTTNSSNDANKPASMEWSGRGGSIALQRISWPK